MGYRVAVLGAGNISTAHLKAAKRLEHLDLVAVADVMEERVNRAAREFGITPYLDYKEMIDKEKPDIAIIALPPYMHKEASVYCSGKGCHLLLEKPMALNVEECEEIIRAADDNNVTLMVGHTVHYEAANRLVKQLIDQGSYGELVMINDTRRSDYFKDRLDWFFNKETSGGGILMNLGSHSIDKIQWYTGSRVAKVKSKIDFNAPKGDIEGAGVVFLETESGIPATIVQSGYSSGVPCNVTEFVFTKGMIQLTWEVWVSESNEYTKVPVDAGEDPFVLQLIDLTDAMEGRKPVECSGAYAKSIISVIEGVYESHYSGKEASVT
ncbi:Gfo/Idh/MocA family protein [Paenibacillus montanisoli]|uniref:Gfo/Idh/MocA family oxidoreductase n=1 Tax=Paenibacillus montanisoli TaxID=2081970 RepID=A0A328U9B7_9BACL|nr:Gfo/Idh/MocA family oxidoreductase [Paenibacillus montanisoli]RAP77505.1 gfo/Idh/MocA family oxidoreductase [Paenibacillus montanisoli]